MKNTLENKRRNKSLVLPIFFVVLSLVLCIGSTLAFLYFEGGARKDIDIGVVELNVAIDYVGELDNVIPGDTIVTSSSFSKINNSVPCYVRAKLEFGSNSTTLTREQKNYILALNANDITSLISTGVANTNWVGNGDNHYYLVDGNGDLLVLNNTSVYTFASNLQLPMLIDIIGEGLEIDTDIDDLYLDLRFQAIQSEHLPSTGFNDIVDLFNLVFKTELQDEFLVRFDTDGLVRVQPQVVRFNGNVTEPVVYNDDDEVAEWYVDSELTTKYDFNSKVQNSFMLYADWVEPDIATQGLIFNENAVVAYVGDSQRVVIPSAYSISGEKLTIEKVSNNASELYFNVYELGNALQLSNVYPLTITNGDDVITLSTYVDVESFDFNDVSYPATLSYEIDKYYAGGDNEVTAIGEAALANVREALSTTVSKRGVSEVVIPDTVTSIGSMSFAYQTLCEVNIPASMTEIGENAFAYAKISSLLIPDTVTSINANAFANSSIDELVNLSGQSVSAEITTTITNENESAFYKYVDGDNVLYFNYLDSGVTLFDITTSGSELVFPASGVQLQNVYDESVTIALTNYTIGANVLEGDHNIEVLTINGGVTSVSDGAFTHCPNLKLVTILGGVEITDNTFANCDNGEYLLTDTELIAKSFKYFGATYLLQTSGYDALTFGETDANGIALATDANGKSWVRTGNTGNYKYYIEYEFKISFSDGLGIVEGVVINYSGTDDKLIIPETYDLVKIKGRHNFYRIVMSMGGYPPYPFTICTGKDKFVINNEEEMAALEEQFNSITLDELKTWEIECIALIPVDGTDYTVVGIDGIFDNPQLVSLTIPRYVTSVGTGGLFACQKLLEIINYSSVELDSTFTENAINIVSNPEDSIIEVDENGYVFCEYNGECALVGYQGTEVDLVLPSTYKGEIYSIYPLAFMEVVEIFGLQWNSPPPYPTRSVVIPEGITTIGDAAFAFCYDLESLTLPSTITNLGGGMLISTPALETVNYNITSLDNAMGLLCGTGVYGSGITLNVGANVTKLPSGFTSEEYDTKLTKIVFAEGSVCSEIMASAFVNCKYLTHITLPSSITTIGDGAFTGCESLIDVVNLSSLEIVKGADTFGGIAKYAKNVSTTSKIVNQNGLLFYNGGANDTYVIGYKGESNDVVLPSNFNGNSYGVYKYAFFGRRDLISITISNGVTEIGESAFKNCESINTITIPESIISIGNRAFARCYSLRFINFNATNMNDLSANNLIFENVGTYNGAVIKIGANVERIPAYLFNSGDSWDPDTGDSQFSILSIEFASGSVCTTIGAYAFNNTNAVKSVILPSSINTIDATAFYDDSKANCYVLCPNSSVATIMKSAGMTQVYVVDTATDFSSITFTETSESGDVNGTYNDGVNYYVRTGNAGAYKYFKKA